MGTLRSLPDEVLSLVIDKALTQPDGRYNACDCSVAQRAYVTLASVSAHLRALVKRDVPLQAHISVSSRQFEEKLRYLESLGDRKVAAVTLQVDRTQWLTADELLQVQENWRLIQQGRPFTVEYDSNNGQHALLNLQFLAVVSLSRLMWLPRVDHITSCCTALRTLHVPLAIGQLQSALDSLHSLTQLQQLRIDVKPGQPPSATDNLTVELDTLSTLHLDYDWTKDELEYSPCLRLDAAACSSLEVLRVTAVDKCANLLDLVVPPSVTEVELASEPMSLSCYGALFTCPGLLRGHLKLILGSEAALMLNTALQGMALHNRPGQPPRPVVDVLDLVLPAMVGTWLEDGLVLPPARVLHITCQGHNDRDCITVKGLDRLMNTQVLETLWLMAPCISNAAELNRLVTEQAPRYKSVAAPGASRDLVHIFRAKALQCA